MFKVEIFYVLKVITRFFIFIILEIIVILIIFIKENKNLGNIRFYFICIVYY